MQKKMTGDLLKLNADTGTPYYQQIHDGFARLIKEGELKPGYSFPPAHELARSLGVTRPTLRHALQLLEREGLVEVKHGVGTFVKAAARRKAQEKRSRLGVVRFDSQLDPYLKEMYGNICAEAALRGMETHTVSFADGSVNLAHWADDYKVDGLIVIGEQSRRYFAQLAQIKLPKVILNNRGPLEGLDHVVVDSQPAIYEGVNELIRLGHREIGFIAAVMWDYEVKENSIYKLVGDSMDRFHAYRRALEDAGIAYCSDWYAELPWTDDLVEEWVRRQKDSGRLPTAIVAFDDLMATLVIRGCKLHGMKVPDDISVMGFGSLNDESRRGELATTTFDGAVVAQKAVEHIYDRMQSGRISNVTIPVESHFKPGRSFAPPPKNTAPKESISARETV
jgi:DNA-binding LacI/PurR family transcriptional regulator